VGKQNDIDDKIYYKMIDERVLLDNKIYPWSVFRSKLNKPDLLLGNGFTLQFSSKLSYDSLFKIFLSKCNPNFVDLFKSFGTTNFELILKYLTTSHKINSILSINSDKIRDAINELKEGLIKSIEQIHPRNSEIDFDILNNIAEKLDYFGDIYTTNYDLYLYHILMLTIDISKNRRFIAYQDYFWGNRAPDGFNQFMDYQDYEYKNIFYLHGALFIYQDNGEEIKLLKRRQNEELIEAISYQIRKGNFPIFVSEGDARDKIKSINSSRYLRFCLDSLADKNSTIVIFGNALHEIDLHIIEAIKENSRDIIYCIYINDRSIESVLEEKHKFLGKFEHYKKSIEFVDSRSIFE